MLARRFRSVRRIALVTQGLGVGGGVTNVARWLREGLEAISGYEVDVHDLATSSQDPNSRRCLRPETWLAGSLRGPFNEAANAQPWGANLVEFEPMRYLPRRELTRALQGYDLIQVVAGGPALGWAVAGIGPPVVLQVATTLRWERAARHAIAPAGSRHWRDLMTECSAMMEKKAIRASDAVLVENDRMLAFVRRAGQSCVTKIPPGIDVERFHPRAAGWNSAGYLLSVCRLDEPRKRLDRLIAAYESLVQADPQVPRLVLAGKGELPDSVRRLVDGSDLAQRVLIVQDVADHDLPGLYQEASVFVATSQEEGLGLSVLEAMASGLPVVATRTAGSVECVVDGSTGWLVAQLPEPEIASRAADAIRRTLDRRGQAMAIAARERCIAAFSGPASLARFVRVYDRLL